ncbi:uncharacterized protein with HEPN domain [Deinobacterium chartae]|uniref:Uncharacterized protein with HEPN domain n=1 Tax=Deinobacterium chartae TaxID=521158 RepID=A0A841I3N3_9DEIO|nr:DUF86 domain-containing protein [Deinobacterium chartae]MBB6098525.1 uncharacterized protein with HEPN domain [Deinobacterium chartae]
MSSEVPLKTWTWRVQEMLEAIERIGRYVNGMRLEDFEGSELVRDAVLRNLAFLGETVKYLPPEVHAAHPDLPWDEMRGTRNLVVHDYFGLDLQMVWHTVHHELPPLVPRLERILREAGPGTAKRG